jgi:hypothetical protein
MGYRPKQEKGYEPKQEMGYEPKHNPLRGIKKGTIWQKSAQTLRKL